MSPYPTRAPWPSRPPRCCARRATASAPTPRTWSAATSANDVEFFYLRPQDIATYVGSGDLDLGITGRDLLIDSGAPAEEVVDLAFGGATFRFAARPGRHRLAGRSWAAHRIATAYPGLVERYLAEHGVKADVIRLDGAVENAVRLGVADVIADVVETGATLRQAGLVVFGEPLLRSSAVLVRRAGAPGNGRRRRSCCAGCTACWWPAAT